jgi:hypothetical protein
MKHMKTLGLLAVALMALTAVFGVSSASAFTKFTTNVKGAEIEEETLEEHVFTVTGATTKCKNIGYEGKTEGLEVESQMVTPSYKECTAFGLPATVTVNNCTYNLSASGNTEIVPVGEKECSITILASSIFGRCHVDVTPQTILAGLTWGNTTTGLAMDVHVTINATIKKIHVTESTGVCPLTVGTHETGTYTGKSTVKVKGGELTVS